MNMAAVQSQTWSVVSGKTAKKTKQPAKTMTKDQRKTFMDKMPRIESKSPVEESSTIYEAFLSKEKSGKTLVSESSKKSGPVKKKKSEGNVHVEKKKDNVMTFEEAISKIEKGEMASVLMQSQTSFPDNKEVWLKDLASYLNLKLESVPEPNPVFEGKPKDFPLCKLNSGCKDVLKTTLKDCDVETLEHLFSHCVQTMVGEHAKGVSTYGYRLFLQSVAWYRPTVACNKPEYLELLRANRNRPSRCLLILWALGLGGIKDLRAGLRVWLDLMLPMVTVRSLTSYIVEYLDTILQLHKDHRSAYGVMTIRDYFPILDLVFSNTHNLQQDQNNKLLSLYPVLKKIAFGEDPKSTLRLFFPSFLSRATPGSKNPLRGELLPCLVTCLMTDSQCFSVWRQMYIKHLPQSSVLLEHLSDNWKLVSKKVERKLLHETLRSFSVTNDELRHNGPEATGCRRLCKDLLQRMDQPQIFSWFWILFLVTGLVTAIIAYDIYTSPNFRLSRTSRFLEEYGILSVLEQAWIKVSVFTQQLSGWLKLNIPHYYARTCETVGPYLRHTWEKTVEWCGIIAETTKTHRQWIVAKSLQLIDWTYNLSPEFWEHTRQSLWLSWQSLKEYSVLLWHHIVHYSNIAYIWMLENVFTGNFSIENIGKVLSTTLVNLQTLMASFVHWCRTMIEYSTS